MPNGGETISENFESSINNLKIEQWENIQMTNTLRLLNGENQTSFYKIEGKKVVYDMETVKKYLSHICKKEDGTLKTWKEMTDDIWAENIKAEIGGGSTTTWTTAVQIALEYLGYDVGKIDGNQGGNTEKAIKKFQRDHNLTVDGKPRPEVIELILNDVKNFVNNNIILSEKDSLIFNEIKSKVTANEKKLGLEGCFKFNSDGTLGFTDKLTKELNNWVKYYDSKKKNIKGERNEETIIEKLLNGVMKPGECRAIEFNDDYREYKHIYQINHPGNYSICDLAECIDFYKNIRFVPSFKLGYDVTFFSKTNINRFNYLQINNLRDLGITMEESKPFIDKYIEAKNIKDLNQIDFDNFIDDELSIEMIKFLFGKINNINNILPITTECGLVFYKLKMKWGETEFEKRISKMLNNEMLNKNTKNSIKNTLESGIGIDELGGYTDICVFLKNKGYHGGFPNLYGYSTNKYFEILKYMGKSNRSFDEYYINIELYNEIYKNNIPLEKIEFFGDYDDIIKLYYEIFENKNGRELYLFLSRYPQRLKNLGGKEIKEIGLTTKKGGYNFCFRGILEMLRSRKDIRVPMLGNNPTKEKEEKWKRDREKIIKEYENILRNYISLDKDENGIEIPKDETFDKIFFASATEAEDTSGVFQGHYKIDNVLCDFTKNFEDCSSIIDKNGNLDQSNQNNLIENIKGYVRDHPNEKILVYLGYHGDEDGCSSNGWKKQDRIKLANISPNIKIMSDRCYFGCVYNNDNVNSGNYIYSLQSPVSGFSNSTSATISTSTAMREGYEKGLGFHELEIYTRLHYDESFSPLADFVDYTDFNTGEKKHGKIGLADAGNSIESEIDVYYG